MTCRAVPSKSGAQRSGCSPLSVTPTPPRIGTVGSTTAWPTPRGGEFLSSPPDEVPRTLFQEDHAAVIRRRTAANRKRGYGGQFPKGVQRGIQSIQQGECLGGRAISVEHAALGVSGPLEHGVVTVAKCLLKRDTRIGDLCQSLVLESRRDVTGASQDRNTCAEECTKFGPSGLAIQGR